MKASNILVISVIITLLRRVICRNIFGFAMYDIQFIIFNQSILQYIISNGRLNKWNNFSGFTGFLQEGVSQKLLSRPATLHVDLEGRHHIKM